MSYYDIVIIGGGLSGAAAAATLRDYSGSIAIIDSHDITVDGTTKMPLRGIALSDGSRRILQNIQVWNDIENKICPVKEIRVSRKDAFGTTRIRAEDEGIDMLGGVIQAADLLGGLHRTLHKLDNLTIYSSAQVDSAVDNGSHISLSLRQNQTNHTIKTHLLILASGRQNDISKMLGFAFHYKNYKQSAIVTCLRSESLEQHIAYERFTSDGLIAVLPYQTGVYIIGRVYVGTVATQAMHLSDTEFIDQLQHDLGNRIGKIYEIGQRVTYPLTLCYAKHIAIGRTVLLGDSAQTIHPVGGQGLNLSLRDIAFLAEHIYGASDPGASVLLNSYCQERLGDVRKVIYFTHLLAKLCIGLRQPFAPLLGGGLSILDMVPSIRRILVRKTLGLSPPWPRLASGTSITRHAKI